MLLHFNFQCVTIHSRKETNYVYIKPKTPVTWGDYKGVKRRVGITNAAKDLGVTRFHLYKVLKGYRQSDDLMERVKKIHPELLDPELAY